MLGHRISFASAVSRLLRKSPAAAWIRPKPSRPRETAPGQIKPTPRHATPHHATLQSTRHKGGQINGHSMPLGSARGKKLMCANYVIVGGVLMYAKYVIVGGARDCRLNKGKLWTRKSQAAKKELALDYFFAQSIPTPTQQTFIYVLQLIFSRTCNRSRLMVTTPLYP